MATLEMDMPSFSKPVLASFSSSARIDPFLCAWGPHDILGWHLGPISLQRYVFVNTRIVLQSGSTQYWVQAWGTGSVCALPHARSAAGACLVDGKRAHLHRHLCGLCLSLISLLLNIVEFAQSKWEYSFTSVWFDYKPIVDGNSLVHLYIWHFGKVEPVCSVSEYKCEHHYDLVLHFCHYWIVCLSYFAYQV